MYCRLGSCLSKWISILVDSFEGERIDSVSQSRINNSYLFHVSLFTNFELTNAWS